MVDTAKTISTYTIFGADGMPIQSVRCHDSELPLYLSRLKGMQAKSGILLDSRIVGGNVVKFESSAGGFSAAEMLRARSAALLASDVLAIRELENLLSPGLKAYRKSLRDYQPTLINGVIKPLPVYK